jgi:hypothetical protein
MQGDEVGHRAAQKPAVAVTRGAAVWPSERVLRSDGLCTWRSLESRGGFSSVWFLGSDRCLSKS